jgi:hypothetical protein
MNEQAAPGAYVAATVEVLKIVQSSSRWVLSSKRSVLSSKRLVLSSKRSVPSSKRC